ncbi:MAG TPA: hypothetical protein VIP79_07310 [Gemmatimonadaceae bacterium]
MEHDLPAEVGYLEAYDRFAAEVRHVVDPPSRTVASLYRFLRQRRVRASHRVRKKELAALTPREWTR